MITIHPDGIKSMYKTNETGANMMQSGTERHT